MGNNTASDADESGFDVPASASQAADKPVAASAAAVSAAPKTDSEKSEPQVPTPSVPKSAEAKPKFAVPKDFAESIKMVQAADAMPQRTDDEIEARDEALTHARFHFSRLQQVPPLRDDGNAEIGAIFVHQARSAPMERLEIASRQWPELVEFISEYKDMTSRFYPLRRENAALKAELAKVQAERDSLQAQLDKIVSG